MRWRRRPDKKQGKQDELVNNQRLFIVCGGGADAVVQSPTTRSSSLEATLTRGTSLFDHLEWQLKLSHFTLGRRQKTVWLK